ncbi:MAG: sensor histidine kinase [Rhodobacteraceae bacterium]|nr:sensor histidine kinase [Paracoccaceae bacterium]
MTSASLRVRLTLIILVPLLAISVAIGIWQVRDARTKASELFDRSLLSTALAVSADVARSNGDAISIETRDQLADTSGGPVFYHVYAPDGVFVTGYATPPVPAGIKPATDEETTFYNAIYYGRDVRVLKFRDVTTIDGLSGVFTYTVWQDVDVRDAFVRDLSMRSFVVMAALIGTVALVVWFGVNYGLRPLLDLEDAISSRSSSDLRPIRRKVPAETRGLVRRLNSLFAQVRTAMEAQNEFISNAAHQLRNPIAGVLAMAEAVSSAPTAEAAKARSGDLLSSARRASDLANKLLTLERLRADPAEPPEQPVDLNQIVTEVIASHDAASSARDVSFKARLSEKPAVIVADEVMVREAISNLADNALQHGGADLSLVDISVSRENGAVRVDVADDGAGVAKKDVPVVLSRFGQAVPGGGSGLGLSIAEAVAERHGGRLDLEASGPGLTVTLRFPARR